MIMSDQNTDKSKKKKTIILLDQNTDKSMKIDNGIFR